jgi:hypothetical protein
MGCIDIVRDGAVVGHICGGGTLTPAKRRPRRWWCFKCRKRHLHRAFLLDSGPYYDIELIWKCDGCHGDNRNFGGW